jgi:pre-rRNA-processing protein IPI3
MLSEFVLASIQLGSSNSHHSSGANIPPIKDAAIFKVAIDANSRTTPTIFKTSSTPCNGLAYNSTHIFAAQADKSTIHVYSIEKGNQEATIPFPEKITAVSTIGDDGEYLILGSESGNVMIWEVSV